MLEVRLIEAEHVSKVRREGNKIASMTSQDQTGLVSDLYDDDNIT